MAQRPTADFNIDPNVTSGTDLANILNRFQDAIDSGNSGASRPAYLDAGGLWVQTGNPMRLYLYDGTKDNELYNTTDGIITGIDDGTEAGQLTVWDGSQWAPNSSLKISNGKVGIGMDPTRSTHNLSAKEQLAEWKTKAKKASWPVVTEGAFEQEPTEDLVAQWIETRAAGDRLQVSGNISATGTVSANQLVANLDVTAGRNAQITGTVYGGAVESYDILRSGKGANEFSASSVAAGVQLAAYDRVNAQYTQMHLRADNYKFSVAGSTNSEFLLDASGTATFSGTVRANTISGAGDRAGLRMGSDAINPCIDGVLSSGTVNLGTQGSSGIKFRDANFTGSVNANQFVDANGPIVSAFDIVEAFRSIKNAVSDETTVEGIQEALTNSLGGLIEKFEAMQSAATQEIKG